MLTVSEPELATVLRDILAGGNCLRSRALGHSMYPFIHDNDTLLIEHTRTADLNAGDVVFFRNTQRTFVIHRLIRQNGVSLLTKGDNSRFFDLPIRAEDVLGRLVQIERKGRKMKLSCGLSPAFGRLVAWFSGHYPSQTRVTRNLGRIWWLLEGRRAA